MKEDIFAKSRNGHLLVDTFEKSTNNFDIRSNGLYPSNVLSNLAHNEFEIDGVKCSSIEGFLQSLKTDDIEKQIQICGMYGGSAKKQSAKFQKWKKTGIVFWQGKPILRDSEEFTDLVIRAYKACYAQNEVYRTALNSTIGKNLTHQSGLDNKSETILTKEEFINCLNFIRGN